MPESFVWARGNMGSTILETVTPGGERVLRNELQARSALGCPSFKEFRKGRNNFRGSCRSLGNMAPPRMKKLDPAEPSLDDKQG